MLSMINLLKKNQIFKGLKKKGNTVNTPIRSIPLNKEWYNNVYSFKKNPIKFFPAVHEFVFKLLKTHFNMYNFFLEKKDTSRQHRKIKRSLLNNKVWISTPEIKHYNEKKAIITLYIYNRLYTKYVKQLNFIQFRWNPQIIKFNSHKNKSISEQEYLNHPTVVTKKIDILRRNNPIYIGTNKTNQSNNENFYLEMIKWLKLEKLEKLGSNYKINLFNNSDLKILDHYNYLINQFRKELIYLKLKQKMLFNQFKFNEVYLTLVINWLQIIYKKKINFDIIILKHHYLSSSILAQMVTLKVLDIKNRGISSRPINEAIKNNFIPNFSSKNVQREEKMSVGMQNVIYNVSKNNKHDTLNKFLLINKKSKMWSSKYIDNFAMQNIENKSIAGLFIKVAGRLTKRYKAQRSVSNLRYRGTLKNVYSAHKGYSSVLSRGYSNINVDKTVIHSKLRIGAFGLTGWVASY